ncbi:molybdopterin-binding protein [Pseudahrensia aquimaris]|uniref:molybdopterin-binding protein n=1 Tax=Pseudahrensia aquimaris TaxID=744461 RepID=UPI003672A794
MGAIVAHALVLPDGRIKKGHALTSADLERLKDAGLKTVVVARLEKGDVPEDEAATRLAAAIVKAAEGVEAAIAATGRVNLYASHNGLLRVDAEVFCELNSLDEGITVASLADDLFVETGRMMATVKIIPFAAGEEMVERFEAICSAKVALTLLPATPHRVGLVATKLRSLKAVTMDKTRRVLDERLALSGSSVVSELRVEHSVAAVSDAIEAMRKDVDLIVLFGASAIVDRRDVLPAAVEQSGGIVHHLGMPMDPGNLLMWASLDGKHVLGAPGCARSPAENGFDRVLARCVTGSAPDPDYLRGLGVGGLLMEIHSRPQPREETS